MSGALTAKQREAGEGRTLECLKSMPAGARPPLRLVAPADARTPLRRAYMSARQDTWKQAAQAVKAGARASVNKRAAPHPDVPARDPSVLLQPIVRDSLPSWAGRKADGWRCLSQAS
eukprot:9684496-Alexandrium_andersonii.AAC.1